MRSDTYKHPTLDRWAAYGKDHACGWFLQIWEVDGDGEDNYLVDTDSLMDGIGPNDIPDILTNYGFDAAKIFYGMTA